MAEVDPWAGLVDPRAALARAKQAAGTLARTTPNSSHAGYSESETKSDTYTSFSRSSQISQGAVAHKPTSHDSRKDRKETCSSSLSRAWPKQPPSGQPIDPDSERTDDRALAKSANRLNHGLTHSDDSTIDLAASAKAFAVTNTVPSPVAHLSGPREWRDGLALLDRWTPPCEGFRSGEWEAVNRAVAHFMDHYATEAVARGWTALDLFGVHGRAGAARVDNCGALMLPLLKNATALTADAITFGPLVYRRRAMPEAVLVWDLVGGTV